METLELLNKCDLVDLVSVYCYVCQDDYHDDLVIDSGVVGQGINVRLAFIDLIMSHTPDEIVEAIEFCGIEGNYE